MEAYAAPRQDNLNSRIISTSVPHQGRRNANLEMTTPTALNVYRVPSFITKGSPIPEHSTAPITIKALPSMKLQTLQQKLRKTFKLPPKAGVSLYLEMSDNVAELGPGDSHDLIWWGFEEGSHLFVYIHEERRS